MTISSEEFRTALSNFASGVTIVTTKDAGEKIYGITVSAFCSVSLDPPLILVCIEKSAGSHAAFAESGVFVVNVLCEDQLSYSIRFASTLEDKFDGIKYRLGISGVPILEDSLASLECRLVNAHENGDHTIYIGQIENATVNGKGKPLLYFDGDYRALENILR